MSIIDAFLCLVLAARIHRTDSAVMTTAKKVVSRLSKADREIVRTIMNSRSPLKAVEACLQQLDLSQLVVGEPA